MHATGAAASSELRASALESELQELRQELAELRSREVLKTQFLSNISHDLRTPITAVVTHAEILRDGILGPLSDRQRESVNGIISGGRQLLGMVGEILTYARASANRVRLVQTEFPFMEVAGSVAAINEPLAARRALDFRVDVAPDLPPVRGDRDKITHVLNNLVGNAVAFTPVGGAVWITAAIVPDERGAGTVLRVEVGDTGIGIAPEHHELIFEEFAQVDSSASRQHHGTGLGLTIARRFVEMHGGRLWVESAAGAGARFFFTIPQGDCTASRR